MRKCLIKQSVVAFFLFLTWIPMGSAQAQPGNQPASSKPDFSGTWIFDVKKSSGKGTPLRPDLPMKITHQDPEFRIIRMSESNGQIVEREFIYYTDGRGETNQATALLTTNPGGASAADLQKERTKSKTRWSGNKLVTRAQLRLTAGGQMLEYELVDEWKLSPDGKVLTNTSRMVFQQSSGIFIPAAASDSKRVYNRH